MHLFFIQLPNGWADTICLMSLSMYLVLSLVPRPSPKSRRGSGVPSNISCHMGWGAYGAYGLLHSPAYKSLRWPQWVNWRQVARQVFTTSNLVQNAIAYIMQIQFHLLQSDWWPQIWDRPCSLWQEMSLRTPDPLCMCRGSGHGLSSTHPQFSCILMSPNHGHSTVGGLYCDSCILSGDKKNIITWIPWLNPNHNS